MRSVLTATFVIGYAMACSPMESDRILGSDLAKADARFLALPADLVAGFSPMPGSQRVLDIRLLAAIARRYGIPTDGLGSLCFEWPTSVLSESKLRAVLEKVLGPDIKLKIVDFSRYPVPSGEIVFSMSDLVTPPAWAPDAPVTWRGHIKYGTRSTAVVWARVQVLKFENWLETATAISGRSTIQNGQIIAKSGWRFPFVTPPVTDVAFAIGKQAARHLAPGMMITPAMLALPSEVERGDMVDVEVASGGVSLRFPARAETAGRRSERVVVFRSDTGKRYQGLVQQKGKVLINANNSNKSNASGNEPGVFHIGGSGTRGG